MSEWLKSRAAIASGLVALIGIPVSIATAGWRTRALVDQKADAAEVAQLGTRTTIIETEHRDDREWQSKIEAKIDEILKRLPRP